MQIKRGERQAGSGKRTRSRARIVPLVFFSIFLILPAVAVSRFALRTDWVAVCGYLSVISVVTVALYWSDKSRAQSGGWRTSESILHFFELAGGWPAAFVAQQIFRHKTVKLSYQFTFWLIGLLHLFIAIDYLRDWAILRTLATMDKS